MKPLSHNNGTEANERRHFSSGLRSLRYLTDKSMRWTTFAVAQISKSAVSPVSKPACRGDAKPFPSVSIVRYCSSWAL
jgi:hypothetical protein